MDPSTYIKDFLRLQREFMAYLWAITQDYHAAEEVFQNAAVVVMQRRDELADVRDFRAWAKEVVRRQALYYLREQGKQSRAAKAVDPVLLEQISRTFVEDTTSAEAQDIESQALRECLEGLPDDNRRMLALRYQGHSFADIGKEVGRTAGAVQRAVSRLRRSLHDCVRTKLRISEEGLA